MPHCFKILKKQKQQKRQKPLLPCLSSRAAEAVHSNESAHHVAGVPMPFLPIKLPSQSHLGRKRTIANEICSRNTLPGRLLFFCPVLTCSLKARGFIRVKTARDLFILYVQDRITSKGEKHLQYFEIWL